MIVRSRTLAGFDAPYVPGWDCHGLPIEHKVETTFGKNQPADLTRERCRAYAAEQIEGQKGDFIRLGVLGDWDNPYKTMDFANEAGEIRALAKMVEGGFVFKGLKPVNWCFDCGSALAEAEVEYQDKKSDAIDVAFDVEDADKLAAAFGLASLAKRASIVIWTTTPWTIPANQALNVHPEFVYALVDTGERLLVLAEELVESCLQRYGLAGEIIARCEGKALELIRFRHPFYERFAPVYLADYVETGAGTGIVHSAPAYGEDDFRSCKHYGMENDDILGPVQSNGVYVSDLPFFGGQFIWKANPAIVEKLAEVGALLKHESIQHSYMHCWRHKTPLIYRATAQWFVGMDKVAHDGSSLRRRALDAIEQTEFVPAWGSAPARHDRRTPGLVHLAPAHLGRADPVLPAQGKRRTAPAHRRADGAGSAARRAGRYRGLVEAGRGRAARRRSGAVREDHRYPGRLVRFRHHPLARDARLAPHGPRAGAACRSLSGRLRSASRLVPFLAADRRRHRRHAPYKGCSPTVSPWTRMAARCPSPSATSSRRRNHRQHGADILRLWVSATDYSGEMAVSKQILQRSADAYRRIRNTARFLLSNLDGFDPAQHMVPNDQLIALDRWAIDRALLLQREIEEAYTTYRFWNVYQKVHNFCVQELGGFYLDIIKDRQYTTGADSLPRRSCQTALYHIAEALVRWIAPILAFTAEEIWQYLPGERNESVMLNTWYEGLAELPEGFELGRPFWDKVMEVKAAVNKELENQRNAKAIGGNLQAEVILYAEESLAGELARLGSELRFVLITSAVDIAPLAQAPAEAVDSELAGLKLLVRKTEHSKCGRCWHHLPDVGSHAEHPEICGRCVENIEGAGEVRHYA